MSVMRIYEPKDVMRYITEDPDVARLYPAIPVWYRHDHRVTAAYETTHDMQGSIERRDLIIPRSRNAFVTLYGDLVPDEHKGYYVTVPVAGVWWERGSRPGPALNRYYDYGDILSEVSSGDGIVSDNSLVLAALTRAIYEVASGIGQTDKEARARLFAMNKIDPAKLWKAIGKEGERERYTEYIDQATSMPEQLPANPDPQTSEWLLYGPDAAKTRHSWPVNEVWPNTDR